MIGWGGFKTAKFERRAGYNFDLGHLQLPFNNMKRAASLHHASPCELN
jgi:hypothetical protein